MKIEIEKIFTKFKNTKVVAFILIIGIVLLVLPSEKKEESTQSQSKVYENFSTYKEELEDELKSILSKIKGAGKVDVMVTYNNNGITHYAKNESTSYDDKQDQKSRSSDTTYVLKNEKASGELPLVTEQNSPEISGVLICAQGAKTPEIKNKLITAVEALLGIKSHRIEVLERK